MIRRVCDAADVFAFGEIVDAVRGALEESSPKHWHTINLFAFGTIRDYAQAKAQHGDDYFIPLTDRMRNKLRLLSLITLIDAYPSSEWQHFPESTLAATIPYSHVMHELQLASIDELESLVIDGVYKGLIVVRLDQEAQSIAFVSCAGRDVKRTDLADMAKCLHTAAEK